MNKILLYYIIIIIIIIIIMLSYRNLQSTVIIG